MKIVEYLKDHFLFIIVQTFTSIFICFMLMVLGLNDYAIIFIALILSLSNMILLLAQFFKKNSFYRHLLFNLDQLDKKYLLSEMVEQPNFLEGEILYEVLQKTDKSMNDHIAKYKMASHEYREYIETWIHEIKTPIAASKLIIGNNKNEITQSLNDELFKIDSFVEQALYYSRSNSVEKDYIIQEVWLSSIVKDTVKKHSRSLIESKTLIELNNLEYTVFADIKWIDFILGQIISNSIKYKRENPKLTIHATKHQNSIVLSIEDNGIGISEKDLQRVFEKGFTGESGRRYAKSTGIGLYLCKKLCDKMGLAISIRSQLSVGTIVEISFPKSKMAILES